MTKEDPYVTVKIPRNLANEVDALIGSHGFATRAEIAKAALRKLLKEYKET